MFRFSLRSLLTLVAISAIASGIVWYLFFRPVPITYVTTRAEWDDALQQDRCVVFIHGDWNPYMVVFRRDFWKDFAYWCEWHTDVRAVEMEIKESNDDIWIICNELWTKYDIPRGGLKNYGGAGRVLWIEDGKVVDYAWCMDLLDEKTIQQRTRDAFD